MQRSRSSLLSVRRWMSLPSKRIRVVQRKCCKRRPKGICSRGQFCCEVCTGHWLRTYERNIRPEPVALGTGRLRVRPPTAKRHATMMAALTSSRGRRPSLSTRKKEVQTPTTRTSLVQSAHVPILCGWTYWTQTVAVNGSATPDSWKK